MTTSLDLVKRFTLTPHEGSVILSGTTFRLATNSRLLMDRLQCIETTSIPSSRTLSKSVWRIVSEPDEHLVQESESAPLHRVSDDGLSFVSMGQCGFFAYDQRVGTGIAFIAESFVRDEGLFRSHFLPALTSLLIRSNEEG